MSADLWKIITFMPPDAKFDAPPKRQVRRKKVFYRKGVKLYARKAA